VIHRSLFCGPRSTAFLTSTICRDPSLNSRCGKCRGAHNFTKGDKSLKDLKRSFLTLRKSGTKWSYARIYASFTTPIGSMYAIYGYIYGNIYHQYTPFMLAYIPAPWIHRDKLQAGPGGIWCPKDHDFLRWPRKGSPGRRACRERPSLLWKNGHVPWMQWMFNDAMGHNMNMT
jgi:hypothetical protein